MICAAPEISRLDSQMAEQYRILLSKDPAGKAGATAAQVRWLADIRDVAMRPAELRSRYQDRIDYLAMAIRCVTSDISEWVDIAACSRIAFDDSDAELDALYRRLLAQREVRADRDVTRVLTESQQAWLKFRDAQCEWETVESRGGNIRPVQISGCARALTRQRIEQLTPAP